MFLVVGKKLFHSRISSTLCTVTGRRSGYSTVTGRSAQRSGGSSEIVYKVTRFKSVDDLSFIIDINSIVR